MNTVFSFNKLELLPEHLKVEVNDFIDFLIQKEKNKINNTIVANETVSKFAGILSNEEADELEKNVLECRKIDLNEW